jgi:hypothetical protein
MGVTGAKKTKQELFGPKKLSKNYLNLTTKQEFDSKPTLQ